MARHRAYGADVVLLAAKFAPEILRSAFLYEPGRHTRLTGDPLDAYFKDASIMFGGLGQIISDHGMAAGIREAGGRICLPGALLPKSAGDG